MRTLSLPLSIPLSVLLLVSVLSLASLPAHATLGAVAPAARTAANNAQATPAGIIAAIRAAELKRADAVSKRDVDSMRQLISGEYYHVETNGRIRSKTEFLQLLARDEFEFRSYDIDDVQVTLLDNGRVALVTGRLLAQMQGANRPKEWRGRFVRAWVLGADGWRNALHQCTEIRAASATRDLQAAAFH